MKQTRLWVGTRGRMVSAGLLAGTFLACGDPVSIRGDKSMLVVIGAMAAATLLLRVVRPLVTILAT